MLKSHQLYPIGHVDNFPRMQFLLEFSEILSHNHICYHWMSVYGISKIMHCGILINMPYCDISFFCLSGNLLSIRDLETWGISFLLGVTRYNIPQDQFVHAWIECYPYKKNSDNNSWVFIEYNCDAKHCDNWFFGSLWKHFNSKTLCPHAVYRVISSRCGVIGIKQTFTVKILFALCNEDRLLLKLFTCKY